jgi:hypothetical protein
MYFDTSLLLLILEIGLETITIVEIVNHQLINL